MARIWHNDDDEERGLIEQEIAKRGKRDRKYVPKHAAPRKRRWWQRKGKAT